MIKVPESARAQQAIAAFSRASDVFQEQFVNHERVRSLLNNYEETLSEGNPHHSELALFAEEDADCHKSLGCFFDVGIGQLSKFFKAASSEAIGLSAEESFSTYALIVEMLLERILDVFACTGMNDGTRPWRETLMDRYDEEGFLKMINLRFMKTTYEPMYQMRRWATFLKHPKELGWLLHKPRFVFAGSEELRDILAQETRFRLRIVDDEFIRRHYGVEFKNELATESAIFEKKVTLVVLPDVVAVTEKICECLHSFVEMTALIFYYDMLNNARRKLESSQ